MAEQRTAEPSEPGGWVWARFRADLDDFRPVMWPPPGPYWCSGEGDDYSIVIAYLRPGQRVQQWWPEASEIDAQPVDRIQFSDRFACPDWWDAEREQVKTGG